MVRKKRNEKNFQNKGRNSYAFLFSVILFFISVVVFLILFFFHSFFVLETKEIYSTLTIGNVTGFDVNDSFLSFGSVSKGNSISRNLILENNYNFPVKVELSVEGNISSYLNFENVVYLDEFEKKSISISTIKISDEVFGDYSGFIKVVFKRDV